MCSRITILRQRKNRKTSQFLLQCPQSRWSTVRKRRSFQVLDSFVSLQHGDQKEISVMVAEGKQQFPSFQKLLISKKFRILLKCRLYIALVLSVTLYSSKMWSMHKSRQRKLESFFCIFLRRILCISYLARTTNEEVLARSRMSTLSSMIMIKRLK